MEISCLLELHGDHEGSSRIDIAVKAGSLTAATQSENFLPVASMYGPSSIPVTSKPL